MPLNHCITAFTPHVTQFPPQRTTLDPSAVAMEPGYCQCKLIQQETSVLINTNPH